MKSLHTVYSNSDPNKDAAAAQLGYVLRLLGKAASHRQRALGPLLAMATHANAQGNSKLYFNAEGQVVGYVAWAFLAVPTERRILATAGAIVLDPTEWNDGHTAWIIDFCALPGHLKPILKDMRDHVFRDQETVRYYREKTGRARLYKEVSRGQYGSFWDAAPEPAPTCECGDIGCPDYRG